jgi:hypothetical protein
VLLVKPSLCFGSRMWVMGENAKRIETAHMRFLRLQLGITFKTDHKRKGRRA